MLAWLSVNIAVRHSLAITSRDLQMLQMIYDYDTCSVDHLVARFFPQTPGRTALYGRQVACYRRVARLRDAGYVGVSRLGATSGIGSGKALLSLGPRGRALVAEYLELSGSELRRLKEITTPYLRDHHLAVCDVRLGL